MGRVRLGVAAFAVVIVMMIGSPAAAADLAIPIDTPIEGGIAPGEQAPLSTVATVDLEGASCRVSAIRTGGTRMNSGNDLLVSSGGDSTTLADVERQLDAATVGGTITLGPTLSIVLVMGEDERFDAAISVELDCGRPPLRSTTTAAESDTDSADVVADAAPPTSMPSDLPNTGPAVGIDSLIAAAMVVVGASMVIAARRPVAA